MFYGDGLLCPPEGYGESIIELLVMHSPTAVFKSFHPGEESLATAAALNGVAPLIGKAPDFVLLSLGSADMLLGTGAVATLENLESLVQLLVSKTHARVSVGNLCEAFLPEGIREEARVCNAGIAELPQLFQGRVGILDLNRPVQKFLEAHRRGSGEKHSLHARPLCPTSMGRVFLSNVAYDNLALEEFFPS